MTTGRPATAANKPSKRMSMPSVSPNVVLNIISASTLCIRKRKKLMVATPVMSEGKSAMAKPTVTDAGTSNPCCCWDPSLSAGRSVAAIMPTARRFASMSNMKTQSLNLVAGGKRSADPLSGAASFAQGMVTMVGGRGAGRAQNKFSCGANFGNFSFGGVRLPFFPASVGTSVP